MSIGSIEHMQFASANAPDFSKMSYAGRPDTFPGGYSIHLHRDDSSKPTTVIGYYASSVNLDEKCPCNHDYCTSELITGYAISYQHTKECVLTNTFFSIALYPCIICPVNIMPIRHWFQ
jgi:hypothetical protein